MISQVKCQYKLFKMKKPSKKKTLISCLKTFLNQTELMFYFIFENVF